MELKPKFIAGIVIGALILYLGLFNISGFGLTLTLNGNFYKEDFNTLNSWQNQFPVTGKINPAGQLQMLSPNGTGDDRRCAMMDSSLADVPLQYTVEWRMIADRIAASGGSPVVAGEQDFAVYASDYWIPVSFRATHISIYQGASLPAVTYNVNIQGAWHVWTLVVDRGAYTADLWMDTQKVLTFPPTQGGGGHKISLDGYGGYPNSGWDTLAHFDYIYVDTGLHPPGSNPTTGSIGVTCTLDGINYQGVQVVVSGAGTGSGTTAANGLATITNLAASGGYTVVATPPNSLISAQQQTGITVTSGSTTNLNFAFVTPTPGTGNIAVYALDSGSNTIVNTPCTVTISGPSGTFSYTTPHTFTNLAYGTYQISSTWKSEYKADSKTVSSGSPSASSTLHFSSSDGGSPTDPLAAVRAFIAQYKIPIAGGGFAIMLVSSIMMFLPSKYLRKRTAPSSVF